MIRPASPRIASLLPAGTEIVAALGAEHLLVGISHECDHPPTVARLPRLTTSPIDTSRSSGAIDTQVRALHATGKPVIAVDCNALRTARPNLIITQGLCEVCAVVEGEVRTLAEAVSPAPEVLPLTARTLPGILADIESVGRAIGREPEARALNTSLEARLYALWNGRTGPLRSLVAVEWLEPLYLAGHWVPEMVTWAGGRDVGASPGDHSYPRSWEEIATLAPDVIVVALCGFGLDRAVEEWKRFPHARQPGAPVWAIDGNAYTSRPGPRVVDGAGLIQQALLGIESEKVVRVA